MYEVESDENVNPVGTGGAPNLTVLSLLGVGNYDV